MSTSIANHYVCRGSILSLVLIFLFSFHSYGAVKKKKSQKSEAPISINIGASVDSAVIMADDYAIALAQNPGMAELRLNSLLNYAKAKPAIVKDSISSRLYNFFVSYTADNDDNRAEAFKECFLAVASEDDPNRGPLYATELYTSMMHNDTIAVKTGIEQLQSYSSRLNLNYDEEISQAEEFINEVRQRKPIRYDIMGCWVGKSICDDNSYVPSLAETFITDIDGNKKNYDEISRSIHILLVSSDHVIPYFPSGITSADFQYIGYQIPSNLEAKKKKSFTFEKIPQSKNSWLWKDTYDKMYPKHREYSEEARSAYYLWSSEDLSSFDPHYFAMLRQDMQASYANTVGNLSRSHVSLGTRFKGQLLMDGMYRIGNAVFDRLAVSTASAWIREITLKLESPKKMTVWTHVQYNISKSNSNRVNTWDKASQDGVLYLKWEPDDDVFFLAQNGDLITLGDQPSKEKKEKKRFVKEKQNEYQSVYGKFGWSTQKYNEFRKWFNTQMFNKLRNNKE